MSIIAFKITPGPWIALQSGRAIGIWNIDREIEICKISTKYSNFGPRDYDDAISNANLIKVAPEMYEVLEVLEKEILLQGEHGDQTNLRLIQTALRKARGESC